MIKKEILGRWTVEKSEELYGIKNWSAGYFNISSAGEVTINPFGKKSDVNISLMDIISGIRQRGFEMPVLLRFENLLDAQITRFFKEYPGRGGDAGRAECNSNRRGKHRHGRGANGKKVRCRGYNPLPALKKRNARF